MNRGLVFYDQSADQIEFYHAPRGQLALLGTLGPEGRQWSHLVAGPYDNTNFSGILLYERTTGESRFYMPNFNGRTFTLGFRTDHSGWRTNWTQIIGGHFGGVASEPATPGRSALLRRRDGNGRVLSNSGSLEERNSAHRAALAPHAHRLARIMDADRAGTVRRRRHHRSALLRGGDRYGRLLYRGQSGTVRELAVHSGWRTSWSQIVPGNFGGNSRTDLLFYDPGAHTGEFYATDQGQLQRLATHTDWRGSWNVIVPGDFAGTSRTSLLFYDAAAGTGSSLRHGRRAHGACQPQSRLAQDLVAHLGLRQRAPRRRRTLAASDSPDIRPGAGRPGHPLQLVTNSSATTVIASVPQPSGAESRPAVLEDI